MGKRAARVIAISSGAVIAVAVLAYAAYASTEWVRYGHADHFADNPFLDRFAPHFEVAERLEIAVAAPAAETYGAAVGLDLRRSWIVRSIFRAREAIMRSHPATAPTQHEFLQEVLSGGRGLLAEEPGRRFVLGAVTKPWEADVKFTAIPPERFAAFNEPGFAKIVWTLEVIPVTASSSVCRTETRVATTDAPSRRRFRRYWALASPGIRLIRREALRLIRDEAERRR